MSLVSSFSLYKVRIHEGWGDSSVGKVLAMQVGVRTFVPSQPYEIPGVVSQAGIPTGREVEAEDR